MISAKALPFIVGADRRAHQYGRPHRDHRDQTHLQRISRDRTRALLVLPLVNPHHKWLYRPRKPGRPAGNRSSKPRRNDYGPVIEVNAESRRLTAGGCCLLRSKRSIAGTRPAKTPRYSARQRTPWHQAGSTCRYVGRRHIDGVFGRAWPSQCFIND